MFEKTYIYPNGEHLLRGYLVNDPKPDLGNASVGKRANFSICIS